MNQNQKPQTIIRPTAHTAELTPDTKDATEVLGYSLAKFLYIAGIRTLARLITLPVYALFLVPWIIIIAENQNLVLMQKIFAITAFLAGNSGAPTLDAADVARAIFVLFIVFDIVIEIMSYRQRNNFNKEGYDLQAKRSLYLRCGLAVLGWGTLIVFEWQQIDSVFFVVFAAFCVFMCIVFTIEYFFKKLFLGTTIMKLMEPKP